MVEGGVSCTGGGGGHGSSTSWEAAGLCLAARPEEDEGGQGPVVKKRRGGTGRWAGEWGGGLGSLGQLGWKRKEIIGENPKKS
jgi:hypothetical protein